MVGIGLNAYKSTNNLSNYILGGRSLGSAVTALSAGASDMSGWLLMGLPDVIYLSGLSESWIAIGLIIGAWLNWLLIAGCLRRTYQSLKQCKPYPIILQVTLLTLKILRVSSAIVILVFFAIYCASSMVAGARLFDSLFGWPYASVLWIAVIATIGYVLVAIQTLSKQGSSEQLLQLQSEIAQRKGAILGVSHLNTGETDIPLERLVIERAISINTATAGGNASLMTMD